MKNKLWLRKKKSPDKGVDKRVFEEYEVRDEPDGMIVVTIPVRRRGYDVYLVYENIDLDEGESGYCEMLSPILTKLLQDRDMSSIDIVYRRNGEEEIEDGD